MELPIFISHSKTFHYTPLLFGELDGAALEIVPLLAFCLVPASLMQIICASKQEPTKKVKKAKNYQDREYYGYQYPYEEPRWDTWTTALCMSG
jgi:hypothetical protein